TDKISQLNSRSDVITAIELSPPAPNTNIRIISCYNPPSDFRGLQALRNWLNSCYNRRIPSLLMMDANLHHQKWSTSTTQRFSPQARDLNHLCGSSSFKIVSPKGIPTCYSKGSSPTVIDLIWANWTLNRKIQRCDVLSQNFGSDHQAIVTSINFTLPSQPMFHNNASLAKLNHLKF
ncbi:hypothetical protein CROQUDRAFT_22176, partial [Cronartium quercuum f. sp. fusiforme G11]